MAHYRFHNFVVASSVALPELVEIIDPARESICQLTFEVVESIATSPSADTADEPTVMSLPDATVLSFSEGVEFVIPQTNDDTLAVRHLANADPAVLRHLLLDHALPRVLARDGYFTAHASGVNHDGRALVFLGASGNGKSSMAASLHRAGHHLLGDDCFTLTPQSDDSVHAMSTYRSLRLLPESIDQFSVDIPAASIWPMGEYSEKVRIIEPNMSEPGAVPVACIFLLADPKHVGPPRSARLSGRDAVIALTKNSFRLAPGDARSIDATLDLAEAIVRRAPVVELHFERDFGDLDAVHQLIYESVAEFSVAQSASDGPAAESVASSGSA